MSHASVPPSGGPRSGFSLGSLTICIGEIFPGSVDMMASMLTFVRRVRSGGIHPMDGVMESLEILIALRLAIVAPGRG